MAESSITTPVVVSGIRVPGISGNQTEGPLSKLYANKFENNIYRFPSDLGAPNRGHVITFTVKKQRESNVDRDENADNISLATSLTPGSNTTLQQRATAVNQLFNNFARIRPPSWNN